MDGDICADWIYRQWQHSRDNRRNMQLKWEENRADFCGSLFADTESGYSGKTRPWKKGEGKGWRSKTNPGNTHQKVMATLAIVLDTVLAGGSVPFMLKPSPHNKGRFMAGKTTMNPQTADAVIDAMSDLIDSQLSECHAERHIMKNVLAMILYGETYAKMVVNTVNRSGWEPAPLAVPGIEDWSRLPGGMQQWQQWKESFSAPFWSYISTYNIFRDWESDDPQECAFIIHRQAVNNAWLKRKMGKPFFIDSQLDKGIKRHKIKNDRSSTSIEGNEDTTDLPPVLRNYLNYRVSDRQYLEYWGGMPKELVEQFEADLKEDGGKGFSINGMNLPDSEGDEIEVCACCLEGEDTVRFVRTERNMRPFCWAKWEDNGDEYMARGVADNCQEMQKVIRGTFRNAEDNLKLAANVMNAIKERFVPNMPKDLEPGTNVPISDDCDDVRKAIQPLVFPDVSSSVLGLFEIASRQLDEDSLIPRIAQGQLETTDQTAKEAAIRQASSLKYIGMGIRNLDDGLIEPMVRMFYEHNMNDPEVADGKGNYLVQALGFSSFQNRTERLAHLQVALNMALTQPKLEQETKIRWLWEQILKSLDLDPDQGLKTDEDKQADMAKLIQTPAFRMQVEAAVSKIEKDKASAVKDRATAVEKLAKAEEKAIHNADVMANSLDSQAETLAGLSQPAAPAPAAGGLNGIA